jgi:Phosphotransferase enzyme family
VTLWLSKRAGQEELVRLRERYAKTLDAHVLREEIARASACGDLDPIEVSAMSARPLRFKKNRFLVLVDVDSSEGRLELVAKGYWDDRARRVLENHRRVWNAGLGDSSAPVRTSRPWGVLERLGVTLTERLPGEHPARGDVAAAERLGRATAFLHACPAPLEPRFDLDAALESLDRRAGWLEAQEPALAAGAVHLAERVRALAMCLPVTVPSNALQGDLGRTSFLMDGDRPYLLDWDDSCRFDAAWEVAYFLVQLLRSGLVHDVDTSAAQRAFLHTYLRARGKNGEFEHRVRYYRSMVCLHKAYRVRQIELHDWPRVMVDLLRSADAGLAALE